MRPNIENPTWDRLEHQIGWYDRKSGENQRLYKWLKLLEIAIPAALPVVAACTARSGRPAAWGQSWSCSRAPSTCTSSRPGCARPPGKGADPVVAATKTALRILGRRVLALDEEKARIDALLSTLVTQTAPQLLAVFGVGIDTAAALLVTAGDNLGRLRSEPPGRTCAAPHPSPPPRGTVTRYRLNRGGDRQANCAL